MLHQSTSTLFSAPPPVYTTNVFFDCLGKGGSGIEGYKDGGWVVSSVEEAVESVSYCFEALEYFYEEQRHLDQSTFSSICIGVTRSQHGSEEKIYYFRSLAEYQGYLRGIDLLPSYYPTMRDPDTLEKSTGCALL